MNIDLTGFAKALNERKRNPKLTIALAAMFVAVMLIRTFNNYIEAPIQSLIVLLVAVILILTFTAWIVIQVMNTKNE